MSEYCENKLDRTIGMTCIEIAKDEPDFDLCGLCEISALRARAEAAEKERDREKEQAEGWRRALVRAVGGAFRYGANEAWRNDWMSFAKEYGGGTAPEFGCVAKNEAIIFAERERDEARADADALAPLVKAATLILPAAAGAMEVLGQDIGAKACERITAVALAALAAHDAAVKGRGAK